MLLTLEVICSSSNTKYALIVDKWTKGAKHFDYCFLSGDHDFLGKSMMTVLLQSSNILLLHLSLVCCCYSATDQ